tara:strand:+ start:159 stop:506 length:348 start_codon:yes stop_codon:yes gene_type:complete
MKCFKERLTLEERIQESERIKEKYADRIPVIVERTNNSNLPELDKHKFLVPNTLTVGQFLYVIRKRIKLEHSHALFIFIANTVPQISKNMSELYDSHRDEDGFLYTTVASENTFG